MNEQQLPPSRLQRWLIGSLSTLLALVIIIWAWMASRMVMQFVFILAAFILGLLAVFTRAAWRHGFRWFLSRGALRFYGWLVAGIISVIVLFYAEENWRGKRAWAAVQREAAARGESLELASVFPPAVPDDQNFALAPGVPELLGYARGQAASGAAVPSEQQPFYLGREGHELPLLPLMGNWALEQVTDLSAWQKYFRLHGAAEPSAGSNTVSTASAPANDAGTTWLTFPVAPNPQTPAADVLLALSRYDSDLAVLRAASQRPGARYPLDYEKGLFGLMRGVYFSAQRLRDATRILSLRAVAELTQGESEPALQDTLLALRLADSLQQMPYETLHRARADMLMLCLQPVWEGLAHHRWNDEQLTILQGHFSREDLLAEFRLAVRGETLVMMNLADQLQAFLDGRQSPAAEQMRSAKGDDLLPVLLFRLFYPTGWLYQDKAWVYRYYERWSSVLEDRGRHISRGGDAQLLAATDPFLLMFVVPRLRQVFFSSEKTLFLETACRQAAVACALERYRLAEGRYPESLKTLVPRWLEQVPADVVAPSGAGMLYRPEGATGFVLYSIGLNGEDDGATPSPAVKDWLRRPTTFPALRKDDWVWRQP